MCLFQSDDTAGFLSFSFVSGLKQACLNRSWGNLVKATAKSERSRTHSAPASAHPNFSQRRQLVRNSFCLSLTHFPRRRASFMNVTRHLSFLLWCHSLFVSVLSQFPGAFVSDSCSNGNVFISLHLLILGLLWKVIEQRLLAYGSVFTSLLLLIPATSSLSVSY